MYTILEGNNVTLGGKITRGQTEWKDLIDIWTVKRPKKQFYVKTNHLSALRTSRNPQTTNLSTIGNKGRQWSVNSDDAILVNGTKLSG